MLLPKLDSTAYMTDINDLSLKAIFLILLVLYSVDVPNPHRCNNSCCWSDLRPNEIFFFFFHLEIMYLSTLVPLLLIASEQPVLQRCHHP
jgi:hypothetical protein